jgi:hypothetical protein
MTAAGRSPARQAEITVMDRIERAMRGIDDLSPSAQSRVREWIAESYPYAGGAAPTLIGEHTPPKEVVTR